VPSAININAVGILDIFLLDFSSLLVKKYGRFGNEVVDLKQEVIQSDCAAIASMYLPKRKDIM